MRGSRWLSRDTVVDVLVAELEITRASYHHFEILGIDNGGMQYHLTRKGADSSHRPPEICYSKLASFGFHGGEVGLAHFIADIKIYR